MQGQPAEVIPFPALAERLPLPPPPELDPLLDAAAVCLARHGLSRTSMSDIARELRVAPSTVYRKVGSVENAAWLLAAREGHRFVADLPAMVKGYEGARLLTAALTRAIEAARDHPVFMKMIRDEPDFVGRSLTRDLPTIIDRAVTLTAPALAMAMEVGMIRRQDPERLAHWITRVGIALVLDPPSDLERSLEAMLLPVIEPEPVTPRRRGG